MVTELTVFKQIINQQNNSDEPNTMSQTLDKPYAVENQRIGQKRFKISLFKYVFSFIFDRIN